MNPSSDVDRATAETDYSPQAGARGFSSEANLGTQYNPHNRTTNCGFCAIARGLLTQGTATDADVLYDQTLERLGIRRAGNHDPIPRQLIFPDPLIDGTPLPVAYQALADAGHGPSSYTISAVALAHNLHFQLNNKDLTLQRQFFDFYSRNGPGKWDIADFVNYRLTWLRGQGRNTTPEAVRRYVMEQMGGQSIVGSKSVNHYINVEIDRTGRIKAIDAQDGREYNGSTLYSRLRTVDLFMHLK
jgi:hypothetical protein